MTRLRRIDHELAVEASRNRTSGKDLFCARVLVQNVRLQIDEKHGKRKPGHQL